MCLSAFKLIPFFMRQLMDQVYFESKPGSGNTLTLTPPLILTRAEMDSALDIMDASLTAATA